MNNIHLDVPDIPDLAAFISRLQKIKRTSLQLSTFIEQGDNMEKIGESPWAELTDVEESHYIVLLNNKIWLFSKKYVPQPTHDFGHHITHHGGYSTFFSLDSRKWSQRVTYSAIRKDENLGETLFVLQSQIFLLLYSHFEGVFFKYLYRFDDVNRTWHEVKIFKVNVECNKKVDAAWKTEVICADQEDSQNDAIFVVSNEFFVTFLRLSVNDNLAAELSLVYNQSKENKLRRPVLAARLNSKILWLEGVHGCGFKIQPNILKEYDIVDKKESEHQITSDCPPFSYTGAKCTKLLSSGEWIHATGDKAVGMTAVKFCGQVWSLSVKGSLYVWKQMESQVPECDNVRMLVVMSDDKVLYVIDPKSGVSVLKV